MFDLLSRWLGRDKVTVLVFHKVPRTPDPAAPHEADLSTFEYVLDFLCNSYRIIPLQDALDGLKGGVLPKASVCLTFDDGYVDWMDGLIDALERRQAHATFYLTTGQFDGLPLWHERIRYAVLRSKASISGVVDRTLSVDSLADRRESVSVLEQALKYLPLSLRSEKLLHLEKVTGSDPTTIPRISQEQVRDLYGRGFGVGAHTINHPILSLTTEVEAMHELGAARECLEGITGGRVDMFAYPNGRKNDLLLQHRNMARSAGYASALTTEPGAISLGTDPHLIPRFTPWGPGPVRMLLQMARNKLHPNLTSYALDQANGKLTDLY